MSNFARAIEAGVTLSLILTACGPKGEPGSSVDIAKAGSGTPVPEMTPGVDLTSQSVDYMFGKEIGTVKSVEPVCNQDRFVCAYRAEGSDGYVGGTMALGVRIDDSKHMITGWVPGGESSGDANGSLNVKSIVAKESVDSLFNFMIMREGMSDTEFQFATWLDSNPNGRTGSDVTIIMSLDENNSFSFRATRNDGSTDFATVGLMTPITVDEVMGDGVQGRQMTFSGLTTDGGVLGVKFDVEKSPEEMRFDAVQELIAGQGEEYTLKQGGIIQKKDGQNLDGLRMENGKLLLGNGQTVECDPNSIKINGSDISVTTIDGATIQYIGGVWAVMESDAGAIVTPEAGGLTIDGIDPNVIDGLNASKSFGEVYKYLDQSFALETGAANAEGVREIMTTNQLGEKVTVATVDASGNVAIDDVLKYKPVGFDEMPPSGEAINQLPTLEQVKQGLFRDNTLLNVEVPEFAADTVLPDSLGRDGMFYIYNDNFVPDPNKPVFKVMGAYYLRNQEGYTMPALIVAWDRGVDENPAIMTAIYRNNTTVSQVMSAVNSGDYDPLPINTVGISRFYLMNGKPTATVNPLTVIGQTPDYVEIYEDWAEKGVPKEFTTSGEAIALVGNLPNR